MELRTYLKILFRHWWMILPILAITTAGTFIYTQRQPSLYTSRGTYVARLSGTFLSDKTTASALDILGRNAEIAQTFSEVAMSRRIKFDAGQLVGIDPETRRGMTVSARVLAGTNIIEISVVGSEPVLARDFSNAVGQATIQYVKGLYPTYELVSLDEAIRPSTPSSPNRPFNIILGVLAGLTLGVGIAFLAESLNASRQLELALTGEPDAALEDLDRLMVEQELAGLKTQVRLAQHQIEQTQTMLSSTQQDTQQLYSAVHTLLDRLEGSRFEQVESRNKNGSIE